MSKRKNILVALTGSIAAYKAAELVRLLHDHYHVKVIMTEDAKQFITELTMQAVSGAPVHSHLLDPTTEASMSHITLAKWADLLLVAPATANVIAKFAQGIADDLLSTLYLATTAPTVIVPAMNQAMWRHPATQANVSLLTERGIAFWGPDEGSQACGDVGPGRMIEPVEIVSKLTGFFLSPILKGLNILVTAGPTRERIDPVRYISNFSSGKMGYALAEAAQQLGAKVTLITGPTALPVPSDISCVTIESAEQMHQAVTHYVDQCDIFVGCAAVADFRSQAIAPQKIKKNALSTIALVKNVDIIQELGKRADKPFLVGFAAESENLLANARLKLQQKNLDVIIANQIDCVDSGFNADQNRVTFLTASQEHQFELMSKQQLAIELWQYIFRVYATAA